MQPKGTYIYGIIPNIYSTDQFRKLTQLGVSTIMFQKISAVVSDSGSIPLDNLNRDALAQLLVHHQKTIEHIMNNGFFVILPMRLGTVIEPDEEVWKILECSYDFLLDTFQKIENLIEVDLVARWNDFPAELRKISIDPEIVSFKEELMAKSDGPSQKELLDVGMKVKQKLKERNAVVEEKIFEALSGMFLEKKSHEVMNDQMITNTAFLLDKPQQKQFEAIVEKLDDYYNDDLNFKIVGPLPCYSFYTLEIERLNYEKLGKAMNLLGIKDITTKTELKKAFIKKAKISHPDINSEIINDEDFDTLKKAYQTLDDYLKNVIKYGNGKISINERKKNQDNWLVKIKN
jgi:plasmid maintenance system antidote protein VapI